MAMKIVPLDEEGRLFLSPDIEDWGPIAERGISTVIDLDGTLDAGVPTEPNRLLYVYFPIQDGELPDLDILDAVVAMGASLVKRGEKVLIHCGLGLNRSALVAGLILTRLGTGGKDAVALLRRRRPGALFNEIFAAHLESVVGTSSPKR